MLKVKGLFYIRGNIASPVPHYWDLDGMSWTPDPRKAAFYETRLEAERVAAEVERKTHTEAQALQATRDIP